MMIPEETTRFSTGEDATVSCPELKHIDMELTRECNLECIHCSSGLETEGNELSLVESKKILKEAKSLGLETVGLTGGEPFLRLGKLTKLVDFCRNEMGVHVHIHSNGTRISRQEARWVKQSGVDITVSFFGSDARTHDAITKRTGSMKSAWRGLRNLLDVKANLTVFVVPMRPNSSEIPSLIELISEEGVEDVRILLPSPTGRALSKFAELELSDEQVLCLRKELARVQSERQIHLRAGFCTRLNLPDLEILKGHDRCYAAENRVHLDAFGNVYPCTASSGRMVFSAGNVQVSGCTLTEVWRFSPLFQFFRRFHSNAAKKCQSCARYGNCMSGCRVDMSYRYGDATIADPQCGGPC
jgi:radical SAM protein with 4Fe4S-binding SPASM domain